MLKNPFLNSIFAAVYIVLVVFIMDTFSRTSAPQQTLFVPMIILSLFVLSAAIMAVLFFYEPARMYLAGKRQEAVIFFSKTLAAFAAIVAVFLAVLFSLK
ncbi:MAG TPA: hypothetical protein VG694_00535 [Candidatus Paceibacterota bacterium]|nr:hypothetical protein [Candidatus Paceibacterota bacterium]